MRRAAPANWSHLPNRNRPRFYTAWTISSKEHRRAGRNAFQPSSVFLLRLTPQAGTQAVRP